MKLCREQRWAVYCLSVTDYRYQVIPTNVSIYHYSRFGVGMAKEENGEEDKDEEEEEEEAVTRKGREQRKRET